MAELGPRKARKRTSEAMENTVASYESRPRTERIVAPPEVAGAAGADGAPKRAKGQGSGRVLPAPGGARGAPIVLPAEDKAARKAARLAARRLERKAAQRASAARPASEKRREIAATARAVLLDPEKSVARLAAMHELATADTDAQIRALALASEAAVLRDILPDYRIQLPTERELSGTPTKEVVRLRKFEAELLARYGAHLAVLEAVLQPPPRARAKAAAAAAAAADEGEGGEGEGAASSAGHAGGGHAKRGRAAEAARRKLGRCVDAATALRCACLLLPKAIRFNLAERLLALVVAQLDAQPILPPAPPPEPGAAGARRGERGAEHRPARDGPAVAAARADADARALAARGAIEALFAAERCGEGSLLAVGQIGELVRRRGVLVREGALRCLLAIDRAQLAALSAQASRESERGAGRGGRGGKRKRDFGVGRDFEGLVGGAGAGAQRDGKGGRAAARVASELLRAMLVAWGRVLRAAQGARAAPAVRCALEGVARFGQLINVELLADTCARLRALVAPPAASEGALAAEAAAEGGVALRTPPADMAAGVAAAHALLRISGGFGGSYGGALAASVTVGNDGLLNRRLYAALGAAPATLRRAEAAHGALSGARGAAADAPSAIASLCVALDCAEHVCGGDGKARPRLCAAFALRLALAALHAPAAWAIAALGAAHRVLVSCPKAAAALTDVDEGCGEPYSWGGPDPELSNALNGIAWPLATLATRSFHPTVRSQAAAVVRGAAALEPGAARTARMAPAEVLGTFSEAAGILGASDEPAAKRAAQRAEALHARDDGPGSLWYPPLPVPPGLARARLAGGGGARAAREAKGADDGQTGARAGGPGGGGGRGRGHGGGRGGARGGGRGGRARGGSAGRGGGGRGRGSGRG